MMERTPAHRILVVEDEANLADGVKFNLEQEGYEVEVLADGEREAVVAEDRRAGEDPVALVGGRAVRDPVGRGEVHGLSDVGSVAATSVARSINEVRRGGGI